MTTPHRTRAYRSLLLLVLVATFVLAAPAARAGVARGLVDTDLATATSEQRARWMTEIGQQLRARWVRLEIQWPTIEPKRGVYDEAYLAGVEELVDLARANGLKVLITFLYTPRWASDRSVWGTPPYRYPADTYQPFYVPRADAADDFGAMVATVAARFKGRVAAYEVWNEPNLWLFFYPQEVQRGDDEAGDDFAIRRYAHLLRACHAAVKGADPDALVVAGATSPIGEGTAHVFDRERTSPRHWAQAMKALDLAPFFDAYSHHPYVPGGARDIRPEARTAYPATTVQLGDIETLLRIFPGKDFYLTEFGYNTSVSQMFGGRALTQAQQADFLTRSYRFAARYDQVKALFWYLRRDSAKPGDPNGVYTGLRTATNARKRSWYAFAGGMRLTLTARSPIPDGTYTKLTGALTCSRLATATSDGGVSGKTLEVQRRTSGAWMTVKTVKTGSGGRYTTWLRLYRDTQLRVLWRGVVVSPARFVDTR